MPTLAPKLPWTHPFAGGYPRLGGQPLPTDPDAIDYLARVAAADGAAVEVGVAMAVDTFVKGCKADGIWDAIKASCILCGARTISGALVPLAGTAPTPYNFVAADYDRSGGGLKGDAATKYLASGRNGDDDPQDDRHLSCFVTEQGSTGVYCGNRVSAVAEGYMEIGPTSGGDTFFRNSSSSGGLISGKYEGIHASSRDSGTEFATRLNGATVTHAVASITPASAEINIFDRSSTPVPTDARLAFYSIGSSLDLAALDNRVSTLVAAIAAAL